MTTRPAARRTTRSDSQAWVAAAVIGVAVVATGAVGRVRDALVARVGWVEHAAPELSSTWLAFALLAVCLVGSAVLVVRRRRDAKDRLRVAIARAANTDPAHLGLRVHWQGMRPVRGRVRYSSALDDAPGSKARIGVEELVTRKIGPKTIVTWEPHRDQFTWASGTTKKAEADVPEPVKVGTQQRRLVASLSSVMKGDIVMTVEKADAVGPVVFTVRYPDTVRDDSDELRAGVQRIVNAKLPSRYRLAWDTEENVLRGERRPPMPFPVPHPVPVDRDQWVIPFGVDEHGEPATWNLRVAPHLLIVGGTGAGKTVLLSGLLAEVSHRGFDVRIVDGKGTALAGFRRWPAVKAAGLGEPEDMSDTMLAVEDLMRERYRLVRDEGHEPGDFDPVLVVLDEVAEFATNVASWWRDTKDRGGPREAPALTSWRAIARLGRECRVHLVLGVQQAASDFFGGTEARDNFGLRIACGPVTQQGAQMAFGRADVGRDVPAEPKGRATVAYMGGEPTEVQVFWTPAPKPNGVIRPEDAGLLEPFAPAEAA